jgi:hypothetical protein
MTAFFRTRKSGLSVARPAHLGGTRDAFFLCIHMLPSFRETIGESITDGAKHLHLRSVIEPTLLPSAVRGAR